MSDAWAFDDRAGEPLEIGRDLYGCDDVRLCQSISGSGSRSDRARGPCCCSHSVRRHRGGPTGRPDEMAMSGPLRLLVDESFDKSTNDRRHGEPLVAAPLPQLAMSFGWNPDGDELRFLTGHQRARHPLLAGRHCVAGDLLGDGMPAGPWARGRWGRWMTVVGQQPGGDFLAFRRRQGLQQGGEAFCWGGRRGHARMIACASASYRVMRRVVARWGGPAALQGKARRRE